MEGPKVTALVTTTSIPVRISKVTIDLSGVVAPAEEVTCLAVGGTEATSLVTTPSAGRGSVPVIGILRGIPGTSTLTAAVAPEKLSFETTTTLTLVRTVGVARGDYRLLTLDIMTTVLVGV